MQNIKYEFKKYPQYKERMLICPKCTESIWRSDIKDYSNCPYCMTNLQFSNELEDYLLDPLVKMWIKNEEGILDLQSDENSQNELNDIGIFSI
jgi:acetyl-CoA carboxylase beta subunit